MTESEGLEIANQFVASHGIVTKEAGVQPPLDGYWTVSYVVEVPGMPDATVDGPTLVLVSVADKRACFFNDVYM